MARMKTSSVVKNVPPEAIELFAKLKAQRATVSSCYEATKRYPDYHRDRTRLHRLMFPPVYYQGKLCCNFWLEDPMYCDRKDPPPHVRGENFKRRCWERGWEARCKLEAALRFKGYKETPAPPTGPADVVEFAVPLVPSVSSTL
jgi:hypothetical protein